MPTIFYKRALIQQLREKGGALGAGPARLDFDPQQASKRQTETDRKTDSERERERE